MVGAVGFLSYLISVAGLEGELRVGILNRRATLDANVGVVKSHGGFIRVFTELNGNVGEGCVGGF